MMKLTVLTPSRSFLCVLSSSLRLCVNLEPDKIHFTQRHQEDRKAQTTPWYLFHAQNQSHAKAFAVRRLLESPHHRRVERAVSEAGEIQRPVHLAPSRQRRRIVPGRERKISHGVSRRLRP